MNKPLYALLAICALHFPSLGQEVFPSLDHGSMYSWDQGFTFTVRRNDSERDHYTTGRGSNLWGLEGKYFIHSERPALEPGERIEEFSWGFEQGIRFQEFNTPCSPFGPGDTLWIRWNLIWSRGQAAIDPGHDWWAEPLVQSPWIAINPVGYSYRWFYSSYNTLQGNSLDSFVVVLNEVLLPGDGFALIMECRQETGLIVYDRHFGNDLLQYTTVPNALLQTGDARITLNPAPDYQGLLLRARCTREWATSGRIVLRPYSPDSTLYARRWLTVPFAENIYEQWITIGISPEFVTQFPAVSFIGNQEDLPPWVTIDALSLSWRP